MPGVVVGISDQENEDIQKNQIRILEKRKDGLTASLLKQKLTEFLEGLDDFWEMDGRL